MIISDKMAMLFSPFIVGDVRMSWYLEGDWAVCKLSEENSGLWRRNMQINPSRLFLFEDDLEEKPVFAIAICSIRQGFSFVSFWWFIVFVCSTKAKRKLWLTTLNLMCITSARVPDFLGEKQELRPFVRCQNSGVRRLKIEIYDFAIVSSTRFPQNTRSQ